MPIYNEFLPDTFEIQGELQLEVECSTCWNTYTKSELFDGIEVNNDTIDDFKSDFEAEILNAGWAYIQEYNVPISGEGRVEIDGPVCPECHQEIADNYNF